VNHEKARPTRLFYFDVETDFEPIANMERHRLKIAWGCYVRRRTDIKAHTETWKFFTSGRELWKWVDRLRKVKSPLLVMAHNIFFDLQSSGFFHYMPRLGWKFEFYHENSAAYILVIHKENCLIKCVDTGNFFSGSVEKLGTMLGLPKLFIDFKTATLKELSKYCRRDVEIIKLAMEKWLDFLDDHDLGKFSLTKASQSMHAFRHRFMSKPIYLHDYKPAQDLEKSSYIGGRVEAFQLGSLSGGPFLTLDINSMYPYVMKHYPVPTKLVNFDLNPSLSKVEEWAGRFGMIAECDLEVPLPIFPVRLDKTLLYPIGRITAFLCTGGLRLALEEGWVKKVHSAALYEIDIVFNSFVDYLFSLRDRYKKEGNAIYEKMLKIILNSLYGKFAQYIRLSEVTDEPGGRDVYRVENYYADGSPPTIEFKMFGKKVVETERVIGRNSFLAVSSHITEYARLLLWKIIEPLYPNDVLYVDTDGFKIRESSLPKVRHKIDENELGALKIDKKCERLEIWGCKAYREDGDRTIKGIPKSAMEIAPNTFEFTSFLKPKTHQRMEVSEYYVTRKVIRRLVKEYDKGKVMSDGRVNPFFLEMW